MICERCSKIAMYEVPGPNKRYFCFDHKREAYAACKKVSGMWDRVHYPEGIKGYTFGERIWN
jgi:hypothetical protein